jgi:hypothetical protein
VIKVAQNISANDIKNNGGTCEKVATDFWECTDKDGKVWWCSDGGKTCVPKPLTLSHAQHITIGVDVVFAHDSEMGPVLLLVQQAKLAHPDQ